MSPDFSDEATEENIFDREPNETEQEDTPDTESAPQNASQEKDDAEISSEDLLRGKRILVVDDVRPMRLYLSKCMAKVQGATTFEAATGREALNILREQASEGSPIDIVFLDLVMPNMSGEQTLQHMRADPDLKNTPVVVVSAKSDKTDIMQCARYRISGYLIKPFTSKKVFEAARKAMLENPADSKKKSSGLSSEQVKDLVKIVITTANQAIKDGTTDAPIALKHPVVKAVLDFVKEHCPDIEG